MARVLGLDIGSNSVGWALVDPDTNTVVDLGVRIFQMGVDNPNSENEVSRNVERRLKRQLRRQYERRRQRKAALRRLLIALGLLPNDADAWKTVLAMDPYQLRVNALDEPLQPYELGRVIDHINARRGFKSNRRVESEEEESGTIFDGTPDGSKPGIRAVNDALMPSMQHLVSVLQNMAQLASGSWPNEQGSRTIGEYLAGLDPRQLRRRKRFTLREHYEIELAVILERQRALGACTLSDADIERIRHMVSYQRPLQPVRKFVGNCQFKPMKKRVRRSHPEFQRFRMYQQLNALRVYGPGRIEEEHQRLTEPERETLRRHLESEGSLDLEKPSKIKALLGLSKKQQYVFNLRRLDAPTTILKLKHVLGSSRIEAMSTDDLHALWNVLNFASDEEWVVAHAASKLGYTIEQAKGLAKIRLEQGHGSLCLAVVRDLLPFMEQGLEYHDAARQAGYRHEDPHGEQPLVDAVPGLAPEDARNPIVQTSFAETRKVVNALIRHYGRPDVVRVELARELRQPKHQRAKIESINRENEKRNEAVRTRLRTELGLTNPSRSDIQKFRLWEEQDLRCIYTGRQISLQQLFDGSVDVDHILPYSRTLDDSYANKIVCLREANARKGDRTPQEAVEQGLLDGALLRESVEALVRNGRMTRSKSQRFFMNTEQMQKWTGENFIERQLNDTRFTARLVHKYLRFVIPDVQITNGFLTSSLRHRWGLNGIIPELAEQGRAWVDPEAVSSGAKSRADHRHHAIDAVVIALTDRGLLQRVATLNARGHGADVDQHIAAGRLRLPDEPIPGLRAMVRDLIDSTVVSHRVRTKLRGRLHEETLYGIVREHSGEQAHNDKGVPLYTVRKPVESLTAEEVRSVADPVVKRVLFERLTSLGVDVNDPKFALPKTAFLEPLFMPRRDGEQGSQIKRVRVLKPKTKAIRLRDYDVYAEPGSNAFIEVHQFEGAKPRWKVHTLIEATQGVALESALGAYRSFKLRINELLLAEVEEVGATDLSEREFIRQVLFALYRVQKLNGADGSITLRSVAAALLTDNNARRITAPSTIRGTKVKVDPIGKLSHGAL